MTITVSGPAAQFIGVLEQGGQQFLTYTSTPPAPGDYSLTLTETLDGFDNSPLATTLTITVYDTPVLADLSDANLSELGLTGDFIVTLEPDSNASLGRRIIDPGNRFWLIADYSKLVGSRVMAGLEDWLWNDEAGAVGWKTGIGDLAPKYDPATNRVAVFCYCDEGFQQNEAFRSVVNGGLTTRINFEGDDNQAEEATAFVILEQH